METQVAADLSAFLMCESARNMEGMLFWVDGISVLGENGNGGLGEAYLKFVNIGRLMKLPDYALNFRVGQVELEIPFTQSKSIWISPYDIYIQ